MHSRQAGCATESIDDFVSSELVGLVDVHTKLEPRSGCFASFDNCFHCGIELNSETLIS